MIKSLSIQNFQSHEKTELTFSPGVNIIIGNSDSGKTAIIRALRFLIWNRPSGTSIRSWWGGKTSVRLCTEEGDITRTKDKIDSYTIGRPGKKDMVLKAFSTSVPEEVSRILNVNEINLQRQLDRPFLLSETPGEVAKHFNKIANLDKIDTSLQNINSWIRELTSDIKYAEEQELTLIKNLGDFDHLEKMEVDIEVLEVMESRLRTRQNIREKLFQICLNYQEVDTAIDFESELLEFEEPLNNIFKLKEQKDDLKHDRLALYLIQNNVKLTEDKINQQKDILSIETNVTNLLGLYKEVNTAKSNVNLLDKAYQRLTNINSRLRIATSNFEALQEKLNKITICPFCGNKLDKNATHKH
jgi:exonuclease SbcC